jgi:cell division septation protein DedD
MLTDHETRPDHDAPRDGETTRASTETPDAQLAAETEFPTLEEPTWLDDDLDEDLEAPRDSAFRGIWIGVAAAAATFVLVFAIPHWLGWYDLGKPGQHTAREATPESVISTVTAKPSTGAPAEEARTQAAAPSETAAPSAKATPPAAPAPAVAVAPSAPPQDPQPKTPVRAASPAPTPVAAKSKAPEKPTKDAAASKRTYSVQIAAFKNASQANRLAARVKRDGYRADVRRVESSAVPWVVRVGGYASREQAESARDALARKGFRGFII